MSDYHRPASPWQESARWFDNGLPANIDAVLHDQWKRTRHRRVGIGPNGWEIRS